jgi:glycosyltransferase involved in cell wall biosynthesis
MLIGVDASRALRARRTGTERYSLEIIRHLVRLPASAAHRWRLYVDAPLAADTFPQLPHLESCLLPARRMWTHRSLASEILQRPPDVLFVPSHVIPLVLPPSRLPPAVVTIHDLGYHWFPEAHTRAQHAYLKWSTRWSVAVATQVIAVSQATARDITHWLGAPVDKVRVVHEAAVELSAPTPELVDAVRARYGLARPYALYVGTIQPRKNVCRLIEAYSRLPDPGWDLVVAGGRGWLSDTFDAQVARAGVAGRVHFPGYVPDAYLPGLLTGATFFCFPSLFEGFGLPVLEAQARGVPVMTANGSSLPEIAGDAALYVDPTDVDAIAAAMLRLSWDEELRQRLIAAGYENVKRFSWDKAAHETLAVLEAAAATRKT